MRHLRVRGVHVAWDHALPRLRANRTAHRAPRVTTATFGSLGLVVGHATDDAGATGCTVIRGADGPFRAAAAVIGRATGTRELALLDPAATVDRVDALLIAGGSAYGLDAAAGVMRWHEAQGRGFAVGGGVVPIVPGAVLFDLKPCGRFDARPDAAMGFSACEAARGSGIAEGSVGAGTGLTVGKARGAAGAMKGGIGIASASGHGHHAVALAAVNAFGDVCDANGGPIAGVRGADGALIGTVAALEHAAPATSFPAGSNTTIAVVALSAALPRTALHNVAQAATAAFHRRIRPAGTSWDGDIVFALAPLEGPSAEPLAIELLAVQALEAAIERAVRLARGRDGIPGLAD
ncbi:MAG: P1 family peptidase [Gemmatimonadaceae bacterium]|nr:P1 family peptidase [Gemmatimonadaceae bacterium]